MALRDELHECEAGVRKEEGCRRNMFMEKIKLTWATLGLRV